MDFDKLLEKHQQDSEIRLDLTFLVNHFVDLLLNFLYEGNAIAKIMGALSTQKFCPWRRTQNVYQTDARCGPQAKSTKCCFRKDSGSD